MSVFVAKLVSSMVQIASMMAPVGMQMFSCATSAVLFGMLNVPCFM